MLDTYKQIIGHQYEASLCTLNACIVRCPDSAWDMPIGIYPFNRVVFHTLFYADFYLESNDRSIRQQPFHHDHPDFFADYEQLEDREPVGVYDRPSLQKYMEHCRRKVQPVIASETQTSLTAKADFARRDFSRAELHVYNIRHIQHHAAQLILRLRIDAEQDVPWFHSGWREI